MVSAASDGLLGFSPLPNLQKIDPKLVQAAFGTASCIIFDPKMMINMYLVPLYAKLSTGHHLHHFIYISVTRHRSLLPTADPSDISYKEHSSEMTLD